VAQNARLEDTLGLACKALGQERAGQCPGALSFLELYFRKILSRLRHTAGMDKASLKFHIEKNDFFGTLATVLDLLRQDLARRRYHRHAETLTRLCDDLLYLQRSHRIEVGQIANTRQER
jgi:hypothetical protein